MTKKKENKQKEKSGRTDDAKEQKRKKFVKKTIFEFIHDKEKIHQLGVLTGIMFKLNGEELKTLHDYHEMIKENSVWMALPDIAQLVIEGMKPDYNRDQKQRCLEQIAEKLGMKLKTKKGLTP